VAPAAVTSNASALLTSVLDPTFAFSDYKQQTYTIPSGIYANYHVLSVSFQARRISTMSSIFLIFPLCLVCLAMVLVLSQEPAKDNRLAVPASAITATMYFSFVVSNMCPPVSYLTRMHLLIFQTYIFATSELFVNYYLWRIQAARKELADNNASNKTLLNDAHWMPRKILPPSTNAVVQPDGVYKPAEKKPEPEKTPPLEKTPPVEEKLARASGVMRSATKTDDTVQENLLLPPVRGPGSFSIKPVSTPPVATAASLPFPPYVEPWSEPRLDIPPAQESTSEASPQSQGVLVDDSDDDETIVGITGLSVRHDAQAHLPSSVVAATSLPAPVRRSGSQSVLEGLPLAVTPPSLPTPRIVWNHVSVEGAGQDGEGSSTVAGSRFGEDSGGGGGSFVVRRGSFVSRTFSFKSRPGTAPKVKHTETGAYLDKTGEFKDVFDLLCSAEVNTYKKLKWGGADVSVFWGLLKVSGGCDVSM
jgi:hypothetical protein